MFFNRNQLSTDEHWSKMEYVDSLLVLFCLILIIKGHSIVMKWTIFFFLFCFQLDGPFTYLVVWTDGETKPYHNTSLSFFGHIIIKHSLVQIDYSAVNLVPIPWIRLLKLTCWLSTCIKCTSDNNKSIELPSNLRLV
jgi:hypothetical protein